MVLIVAASTHNMGNLEAATGDFEKAMGYFKRAVEIRLAQGETAANQLALLYLCIGRVHTQLEDFDKALKMFSQAESLFVRQLGAEKHYMAQ
jgi:tetratricopeptide (TPR) repeat protein